MNKNVITTARFIAGLVEAKAQVKKESVLQISNFKFQMGIIIIFKQNITIV